MIRLHDVEVSGNAYKVRLLLSLLGLKHQIVPIDFAGGQHKSTAFLKLNPLGEIPVLEDGDVVLRDSQAILLYLARKYGSEKWLPTEPVALARVGQWLSTAANEIQNGASAARAYVKFGYKLDIDKARDLSNRVLGIMDEHLSQRDWLEMGHPTVADIACYPYLGLVPEGGVALDRYKSVMRWMDRIKDLPNYVPMPGIY
ncbi:glutathione S-transferase family protein [Taklimakanibacter deserti]|uniref:glutathione S-transferase family protein n=1 Tax=Taklimakanibacter deserti TaxID=2267839 RepID=UPI000E656815